MLVRSEGSLFLPRHSPRRTRKGAGSLILSPGIDANLALSRSAVVERNSDASSPLLRSESRGDRLRRYYLTRLDRSSGAGPGTISVWDDDHLVFADTRSPGTITNLRKNPTVEINVVDPFARKGYRFKGTGEVIVDGELFQQITNFYRGRWVDTVRSKSEARIRGFVLVKVESALPLTSPAYDDTSVDEQAIRKHWISYFAALHEG